MSRLGGLEVYLKGGRLLFTIERAQYSKYTPLLSIFVSETRDLFGSWLLYNDITFEIYFRALHNCSSISTASK